MLGRLSSSKAGTGGKSAQAARSAELREQGVTVCETFEPGATGAGAVIRELLLHRRETIAPTTEALLMAADRAQHVAEQIAPVVERGDWVVCDRYLPSSLVYQGVARGIGVEVVEAMNRAATAGVEPDIVIVFDVEDAIAQARAAESPDRLEAEGVAFHAAVRAAYRTLAAERGWAVVDGGVGHRGGAGLGTPRRCWQDGTVTGEKWDRVVGQDRAVALLRRAGAPSRTPGTRSGTDEASRCFAAAVIAPDDDRTWTSRCGGADVIEVDPADNRASNARGRSPRGTAAPSKETGRRSSFSR
jgi:dTMP kinase